VVSWQHGLFGFAAELLVSIVTAPFAAATSSSPPMSTEASCRDCLR
jgi:hypothetical protein